VATALQPADRTAKPPDAAHPAQAGGIDWSGAAARVAAEALPVGAQEMVQRLHFVFGGELVDPQRTEFRDVAAIDMVGVFPDYATAFAAWKGKAQATVDNAHMRYFIAHIHRLTDEEREGGPTEEIG
jgi:hypothetical protein